jgi:hypothetical protein
MGLEGRATHVRGMVDTVEVDAIPAGWKEGLCSHTKARLFGKTVAVVTAVCIQAYVLHSLVFEK